MMPTDLALRWDPSLAAIAQDYAADNRLFLKNFAAAWTKLMNADRFEVAPAAALQSEGPDDVEGRNALVI
jgi:catalase (peroxidase I)